MVMCEGQAWLRALYTGVRIDDSRKEPKAGADSLRHSHVTGGATPAPANFYSYVFIIMSFAFAGNVLYLKCFDFH